MTICAPRTLYAEDILDLICSSQSPEAKTRAYIIMGRVGPTGKTWLCNKLRERGYSAFELTENTFDLVEYTSTGNHYRIEKDHAIIVLNRILPWFETVKGE